MIKRFVKIATYLNAPLVDLDEDLETSRFRIYLRVFHETLRRGGRSRRWWPWQLDPVFPFLWFRTSSKKITIISLLKYFITVLSRPIAFISLTNKFVMTGCHRPLCCCQQAVLIRARNFQRHLAVMARGSTLQSAHHSSSCSLNWLSLISSKF